jgi:hypothetical protein
MNVNDTVLISSKVVQLILVPILRELAAVLLAIAISKDCKARDNGSGTLWGVFTILSRPCPDLFILFIVALLSKESRKATRIKEALAVLLN